MINYHKILEMHLQGISQRTISSSTGHSRDKIREVVNVYYDEVEQLIKKQTSAEFEQKKSVITKNVITDFFNTIVSLFRPIQHTLKHPERSPQYHDNYHFDLAHQYTRYK